MKQSLVLALALLLLAAASVAGCAGEPTPNVLRNAPRATGQTEASGEPGETTPAGSAVPTSAPHEEEAGESAVMPETPAPSEGDLPIFIEMTRVTVLPSATPQSVPMAGRPNSLFAYIPGSRTLLLRPGITVAPTTKVLIALALVIQGPTGELVRGDLFQVPGPDRPPLEVADFDYATGGLQLAYSDQVFELAPGQSRTFKRTLADQGPVEITVITSHGHLAAIGALPEEAIGR
jgi:hypothetical protein